MRPLVCLVIAISLMLTACGQSAPPQPTPSPAPTTADFKTYYDWNIPTEAEPGGLVPAVAEPQPTLMAIEVGPHDGYDRIVFRFKDNFPDCKFWYSPQPRDPGQGQPISFAAGTNAYLTIEFQGATAHDDKGVSTIGQDASKPGLVVMTSHKVIDREGVHAYLGLQLKPTSNDARPVRYSMKRQEAEGIYSLAFDVRHVA